MRNAAYGAQDVAALGEDREVVLEGGEVACRAGARSGMPPGPAAQPAAQGLRSDALGGLRGEREQDRQLGPMVELAGDDLQRVDGEHRAELVVGEAEPVHELGGGGVTSSARLMSRRC